MIYVTRLNHTSVVLNCDLIEYVEATPDTVISLTTGQKLMVLESAEEVVHRVMHYRRLIHAPDRQPAQERSHELEGLAAARGSDSHGGS